VFAPGTGRFLLPSLAALVVVALLEALGVVPRSLVVVGIVVIGAGYWLFFAAFFRDPERRPGAGIVAPADGKVVGIERADGRVRIATFMNVTDVHVNRFPLDGRVTEVVTSGSGFRPAYLPDARHNLQCRYALESALGPVEVIQMTGIVARRLVPLVAAGEQHVKGDRLGMILLGSRVDLILPADRVTVTVAPGAVVRAGETTLARERDE
jgi:phosphatidylserine decarboxylase